MKTTILISLLFCTHVFAGSTLRIIAPDGASYSTGSNTPLPVFYADGSPARFIATEPPKPAPPKPEVQQSPVPYNNQDYWHRPDANGVPGSPIPQSPWVSGN